MNGASVSKNISPPCQRWELLKLSLQKRNRNDLKTQSGLWLTDLSEDRGRCPSWRRPTAGSLSHFPEQNTERDGQKRNSRRTMPLKPHRRSCRRRGIHFRIGLSYTPWGHITCNLQLEIGCRASVKTLYGMDDYVVKTSGKPGPTSFEMLGDTTHDEKPSRHKRLQVNVMKTCVIKTEIFQQQCQVIQISTLLNTYTVNMLFTSDHNTWNTIQLKYVFHSRWCQTAAGPGGPPHWLNLSCWQEASWSNRDEPRQEV